MTDVLISLGSNSGDSSENLNIALSHLNSLSSTSVIKVSKIHKTAPWGKADQPDFLNQSVLVATDLSVGQLMENILRIEKEMGRVREEKWGPRLIDIDIILFGSELVNSPAVIVPHPYMQDRHFVLAPSAEIAPDMIHPGLQKSITDLLKACTDVSAISNNP